MRRRLLVLAALAVLLAVAALLVSRLNLDWAALPHGRFQPAIDSLRGAVQSAGGWAYAAYLLVFILLPLLMVPVSVICIAGGLIFPPLEAALLIWLGAVANTTAAYWLVRTAGRSLVERLFLERLAFLKRMDERAHGHGFKVSVVSRFLPWPYVFPGYAAGLSGIRFRDFIAGTALAMLPWSLVYAFFSKSLTQGGLRALGIFLALFALLVGAGWLVARQVMGSRKAARSAAAKPRAKGKAGAPKAALGKKKRQRG